jgi:hypothetical protein
VYGNLYKQLKRGGIGGSMKTLVFPGWVRFAVRRRFADGGQWDAQYEDNPNVSIIILYLIYNHIYLEMLFGMQSTLIPQSTYNILCCYTFFIFRFTKSAQLK